MKALFIGGTGTISMAITRALAVNDDWELYLLNRGNRQEDIPEGVHTICADINDEKHVEELLSGMKFDVVCDFIGFELEQVKRDYRLFKDKTRQYMYISSASAYNKPCRNYIITEGTALANPYWEYSRNKILCERFLMEMYETNAFPVTIVRPSQTYDDRSVPLSVHGDKGTWQVVKRMMEGKPVIIHGDGTSLWTLTRNEDFAKGFIGLMGNPQSIGEAFQITSDESLTWNQIYEEVAHALNVELKPYHISSDYLAGLSKYDFEGPLIGDHANSVVFDNAKIKRIVPDFACTIRFDQGIRKTIDYCMTHKECQVEDPEFDAFCDKLIESMERVKEQFA